jgi:hypothetical protein
VGEVCAFSFQPARYPEIARSRRQASVVLALEAADQGYDIVILEGRAVLLNDPQVTAMMPSFVAKYAEIPRRWPPEEWARKFSQAIRVTPTKLMAWITKPGAPEQHRMIEFEVT